MMDSVLTPGKVCALSCFVCFVNFTGLFKKKKKLNCYLFSLCFLDAGPGNFFFQFG